MINLPEHSNIAFKALTQEQIETIRIERNKNLGILRTPYLLTYNMQQDFYRDTINRKTSNSRFFAIHNKKQPTWAYNFSGYCGIENIEWENRRGEISILILEKYRNKGIGNMAVEKLLRNAFFEMNLQQVWGECYILDNRYIFWETLLNKYKGYIDKSILSNTKYWDGIYHNSLYFSFNKEQINEKI